MSIPRKLPPKKAIWTMLRRTPLYFKNDSTELRTLLEEILELTPVIKDWLQNTHR
jgi:hypothetical protein